MFRFLHGADLHLGTPFAAVGRILPEARERLMRSPRRAWEKLVQLALTERVEFLVLAGDVFDTPEPELGDLLAFRDGLERLAAADTAVLIAPGNHDTLQSFSKLRLPKNTTVFGPDEPTVVELRSARVCGIGYADGRERRNLARRFSALTRSDLPTVAVLHANVGGDPDFESYAPAELHDLTDNPAIDYWALGHIHKRRVLHDTPPLAVYSGALQSCHVNVPGACGAYLVEVGGKSDFRLSFRECGDVRFFRRILRLTEETDSFDGLLDAVSKLGKELDGRNDGVLTVVALELEGRTVLAGELARRDVSDLSEAFDAVLGPGVRLSSWSSRLTFPVDRAELLRGSHLAAAVVELAAAMRNDGCVAVAEAAAGLRRSIRQMPEFDGTELPEIVSAAENELLERLADGRRA